MQLIRGQNRGKILTEADVDNDGVDSKPYDATEDAALINNTCGESCGVVVSSRIS